MNTEPSALAERISDLRDRERRLADMVRGMNEKAARLDLSRRERVNALENIRTAIARALLHGSRGPAQHGDV